MRYFLTLTAMLLIFCGCKQDEPVDPCTNGFLDPGETAPDCGGDCAPCSTEPFSFLSMKVNGVNTAMTTSDLHYDGTNWTLLLANDSLNIQLALGDSSTVHAAAMPTAGTYCYLDGVQYLGQQNGSYAISAHDLSAHLMDGFFQITFFRPGFIDSLKISNGQFENLSY